jgi:superfamily II DNA or RNA helicase
MSVLSSAQPREADALACVPCLRLDVETLLVADGERLAPQFRDQQSAVAALSFLYGDVRVRAAQPLSLASGPVRDRAAEGRARYLLESLGAVELGCLDDVSAAPGVDADYLVRVDGDVHALCSFTAYAVPQLRALGWRVEIAPRYPFQVVSPDAPWYAHVDEEGRPGWFNLELGIEVGGKRVNLLPGLLDMLERIPASARLDRLAPPGGRAFALPTGDGRYVTVPPERLRIMLRVLGELYQGQGRATRAPRVTFPAAKAGSLAQLDAAFTSVPKAGADTHADDKSLAWTGHTAIAERGRALASRPSVGPAVRGLNATLRPYQEDGVRWLQHLAANGAGGVLADDMGLGKTLQTIAHIVTLKAAGRLDAPALIVAPTSVAGNWRREIGKFAPDLRVQMVRGAGRRFQWALAGRCDVAITTYPVLVRDEAMLASRRFSIAILDEAQTIKNPRSQAHRVATGLNADLRLALSGTPVENSLGDLWSLFSFTNPGLLGDAEWFHHRFSRPIERDRNVERLRALRDQVAPFILRRTKEEVARDLPPQTEIVRPVELRGPQRDLYESLRVAAHADVRRAIAARGVGASTIAILDALMKLRQVCCDPRLMQGDLARGVASAKYDMLMELLEQQLGLGRRVLVFSQFARMLQLVGEGLDERGVGWVSLTGATADRQKPIDDFQQRRANVFLITLKAGGTGLNLTSADTVVHYDPWWNPAAQAQATDRAYRIGQTRPVFVYNLVVAGSVEERMLALQQRKRQLADGILARDGAGLGLTTGEVDGLFAPLPDA